MFLFVHPPKVDGRVLYSQQGLLRWPQVFDLGDEFGSVVFNRITGNDISRTTVNPTSNGRAWDVQLGKEVPIPGLADCLFNSIVVGSPRVESFHLEGIGRCL